MLTINEVPTPALIADLDLLEANLARMAQHVRCAGKGLRPHVKAHKCVEIARSQMAAGALGLSVATVQEAELMARAGIAGLLLTSPVADPLKIARIVATGAVAVVDHLQQVEWYAEAASRAGRRVDILIDLDVGDHRTGAVSPEEALCLARAIERSRHLWLRGVQAYSVRGSHVGEVEERKLVSQQSFQIAAGIREEFRRGGLCCDIVSGGSTGSWEIDSAIDAVDELQPGSYVLMDLAYRRIGLDFKHAMRIRTTVVSANHAEFVTVDGGLKAFSTDRGYGPEAVGLPGSQYRWGGDEFGYLDVAGCAHRPRLGDRIDFIPPHCDPTVNLYDRIYAARGEIIEAVWPVMDRMRG